MAGAPRGAFILFEGVDRSGKSTQAAKLVETLNKQGVSGPPHPDRAMTTMETKQRGAMEASVHTSNG